MWGVEVTRIWRVIPTAATDYVRQLKNWIIDSIEFMALAFYWQRWSWKLRFLRKRRPVEWRQAKKSCKSSFNAKAQSQKDRPAVEVGSIYNLQRLLLLELGLRKFLNQILNLPKPVVELFFLSNRIWSWIEELSDRSWNFGVIDSGLNLRPSRTINVSFCKLMK